MHSIYGEHSASYLRNQNHQHSIWRESFSKEDQIIIKEVIKNYFSTIISPDFLSISDKKYIIEAEDRWWMNYDSGVPATEEVNKIIADYKDGKGSYVRGYIF